MDNFITDKEVPRYIYICGITGIVCLALAFIFFFIFYFVYEKKIDVSVEQNITQTSGYYATSILSLVFTVLGLILSSFILYGHIIKQKKDPQIMFGHHSYIEFPDEGKFLEIEKETSQIYSGGKKVSIKETDKLNTDFL